MKEKGPDPKPEPERQSFFKDIIPDDMELGIIEFSTNATFWHPRSESMNNRQSFRCYTICGEGWTAIGKGLD